MSRSKHHSRYRRKPATGDRTRNMRSYRVTGSWNQRPERPAVTVTPDRALARGRARQWADDGAYVIVEEQHDGMWRTLYEVDGPALLAAEFAAEEERRRAARREQQLDAEYAEQVRRHEAIHAEQIATGLDDLARIMARPPVPRDAVGQASVRHTAGGRR
ncbi:hypothetical protein [Streptomyces sp. CH6]|uniref:hypothetical protein n=1 Tax=unclassified Streptomyces TaxID=2593676 RepID=UPI003D063282